MKLHYQTRIRLTAVLMVTAVLLIMAALWLPPIQRDVHIVDAMFIIDITDSMNVEDAVLNGETVSRMTWAKEFTRRTMLDMPCGSHVGLGVFSEARSLILVNPVEVCSSYHDLTRMLNLFEPHMAWVRSSEVSKAVYTAIRQARDIDPQPTIVFVTDGHESPPVHESLFPKFGGTPGEVGGVLVGVGGDDMLPIPKTNADGVIDGFWDVNDVMHTDVFASLRGEGSSNRPRTEHLSSQKKSHLQTLADRVGFDYVSMPGRPSTLVRSIRNQSESRELTIDFDMYAWLSGLALALLLLVYLPYGRLLRNGD